MRNSLDMRGRVVSLRDVQGTWDLKSLRGLSAVGA